MNPDPAAEGLAAVRGCIVALGEARDALDDHYRWCDQTFSGAHNELGGEARKRLGQLIWLLSEVEKLVTEAAAVREILLEPSRIVHDEGATDERWGELMQAPAIGEALRRQSTLNKPLETLTESFYWLAARTRSVIRRLPRLERFEAAGVRNVRNHLLEHPERKDSGVVITSFASGGPVGPVLKGVRYGHQTEVWPDRGLFVNASEFATNLRDHAIAALSESRE